MKKAVQQIMLGTVTSNEAQALETLGKIKGLSQKAARKKE